MACPESEPRQAEASARRGNKKTEEDWAAKPRKALAAPRPKPAPPNLHPARVPASPFRRRQAPPPRSR